MRRRTTAVSIIAAAGVLRLVPDVLGEELLDRCDESVAWGAINHHSH
jgi:hypothetical protein